jgi:hypothetical protein
VAPSKTTLPSEYREIYSLLILTEGEKQMKKLFSDEYTTEDVRNLQTICVIAEILLGVMALISSAMGLYL